MKMRYSTEPKLRKYVKGYGVLSFARKFGDKYGKKLMDTATKTGIDAAKIASKRVIQKTAEATGDLIRNKIADKITSIGKPKEKEKAKEIEEMYIPPEKDNRLLMIWDCFEHKMWHHCIEMEFQKIANFLDTISDDKDLPRFVTKKWIEVYDQSEKNYNPNKEIRIKPSMLRSDLCDFSDAYIVVKGNIIVDKKTFTVNDFNAPSNTAANATATNTGNDNSFGEKKLVFKSNAPFINCISKINGVQIDNAEDLDVVMPMYNLLEYSKNYRKTTGSLWNYYRDETNSGEDGGINYSIMDSKSFDCKANFIEDGVMQNNLTKNAFKIFEQFLEKYKYTTD